MGNHLTDDMFVAFTFIDMNLMRNLGTHDRASATDNVEAVGDRSLPQPPRFPQWLVGDKRRQSAKG